ncbi:YeeE/YedE family protein [Alkaliphilus serpentinus]|uniref:YeeE/YedE family protein n=1 Tax=Alkaliphilus serpentinus TaxID=1482731 RepID=A0A833M9M3_9FIRM|nr:YeeE/YedE family protein [Alkaliphilus serpentinus]KAB3530243.1 YeeE/YedE family protein [Alkaliphilus serpentinus]
MTSNKIEELIKKRQMENKKKKNQTPYGIGVTLLALVIYLALLNYNLRFSSFWIIGILIGVTMQRSRFCFAASFRDPIMVGSTSLLKAILIALIISTVGFFIIQYNTIEIHGLHLLENIPGQLKPVGLHTALGAILFGVGMVIAGGCASGTLMRIGEGYILQIVVLIGFIIGATMGARHFEFWDKILISKSKTIYIPKYLGLFPSLIIQLIVLVGLYFVADWFDKKNSIMSSM